MDFVPKTPIRVRVGNCQRAGSAFGNAGSSPDVCRAREGVVIGAAVIDGDRARLDRRIDSDSLICRSIVESRCIQIEKCGRVAREGEVLRRIEVPEEIAAAINIAFPNERARCSNLSELKRAIGAGVCSQAQGESRIGRQNQLRSRANRERASLQDGKRSGSG